MIFKKDEAVFPTSFEESDSVLDKPEGSSYDQCEPLAIKRVVTPDGIPCVVSCWKATQEELDEIVRTGRVWLTVWGNTMPPACVSGSTPFEPAHGES